MNAGATPTTKNRIGLWLRQRWQPLLALFLAAMTLAALSTCSPRMGALDEVRALGALRVITTNSPTTYYVGAGGPAGFEHDLAKGFAEHLGVNLEIVVAPSAADALRMLQEGRGHVAAAGIAISPQWEKQVRFTPPVMKVVPQLVGVMGQPKPKDLGSLRGLLKVPAGSAYAEMLARLKAERYPELAWEESKDEDTEELLYEVANTQLSYTIASSEVVAMHQRYYPRLRVAFPITSAQELAWALPAGRDNSLLDKARDYLEGLNKNEIARLRDRYFSHAEQVDYVSVVTLAEHIRTRLPPLQEAFMQAAEKHGLDWKLLAAMGYQESHWRADAISPTGVRGIMMLTLDTAALLKVSNREDPVQSIFGGARYFRQLLDQMPKDVEEPERTWMALAAYNMGMGHLLDARWLTKRTGGDPLRWLDVRNALPLLTQSKWYGQLKFGYARGYEAVTYVSNVRTYYDMISWVSSGAVGAPQGDIEPPLSVPHVKPEDLAPLNINSPLL